ncbi:hypothetical protein [Labrys neptuniae]
MLLGIEVAQVSPQGVKVVAACAGLQLEITHGCGGGVLDLREPVLEIERRQAFCIGAQLILDRGMGGFLGRFDPFDDLSLDRIGRRRCGGGLIPRSAFTPPIGKISSTASRSVSISAKVSIEGRLS